MDESSILGGGQQLVDPPQTRIPSWLVWTIRKSGVSPKIRPKIRFSGIETRFAAKPSNWKGRRKDIFLFFCAPKIFVSRGNEDSTRTSFSNRESRKIFLLETNIEEIFEFSRRENVLRMQNTFGSETLLKVVSREYFSKVDELPVKLAKVAQK